MPQLCILVNFKKDKVTEDSNLNLLYIVHFNMSSQILLLHNEQNPVRQAVTQYLAMSVYQLYSI